MKPRVLFCDLGNVILPFDFEPAMKKLAALAGKSVDQVREVFFQPYFQDQYERGEINSQEFLDSVRRSLGLGNRGQAPISDADLALIWNDIFTENWPMIQWLESVLGRFPIWGISNTNALHFSYIKGRYPIVDRLDGWVLSCEVGYRKPDLEIFRVALRRAGVQANEAFFVDDMEVHVQAARSLGIQAAVFRGVPPLAGILKELGYPI